MVAIWLRRAAASALVFLLVNCNSSPPPQPVLGSPPSIPQGAARIWYYRTYEPYVSRNLANIVLNGTRIRPLPPLGPGLYLDVAPGNYRVAVENYGVEANQSKDLNLTPGQEVFVKIVVSETFLSGGGGQGVHRDAFFLRLVSPGQASAEIERHEAAEPPDARRPLLPASSASAVGDPSPQRVGASQTFVAAQISRQQVAQASARAISPASAHRDPRRVAKHRVHRQPIAELASDSSKAWAWKRDHRSRT